MVIKINVLVLLGSFYLENRFQNYKSRSLIKRTESVVKWMWLCGSGYMGVVMAAPIQ